MIRDYKKIKEITVSKDANEARKQLLSFAYQLWMHNEFNQDILTITPGYMIERGEHHVYTGIPEKEFIMYTMFIDTQKIKLKGKFVDATVNFIDKTLELVYYEKDKGSYVENIISYTEDFHEVNFEKMATATYFYINNNHTAEFYQRIFNFVCDLECVNLKENGIMVTNRKGGFHKFYSKETDKIIPNKFYYSDNNIFIGFHKKTDMLVLCNIPKEIFVQVKDYVRNTNKEVY